jgi:hypothetical protein
MHFSLVAKMQQETTFLQHSCSSEIKKTRTEARVVLIAWRPDDQD